MHIQNVECAWVHLNIPFLFQAVVRCTQLTLTYRRLPSSLIMALILLRLACLVPLIEYIPLQHMEFAIHLSNLLMLAIRQCLRSLNIGPVNYLSGHTQLNSYFLRSSTRECHHVEAHSSILPVIRSFPVHLRLSPLRSPCFCLRPVRRCQLTLSH
jgi:hypothetical protein